MQVTGPRHNVNAKQIVLMLQERMRCRQIRKNEPPVTYFLA